MTHEEYIKYALNKKQIEYHSYDPRAKFQCIDLVNDYIDKVLNLTSIIGTDAKDVPSKVNKEEFDVIPNTEEVIPKQADIAVWSGKVGGGAGHISVVKDNNATVNLFSSIDQNWSEPLYVTLETHSYQNVSHFMRAKKGNMALDWKGLDPSNLASLNVAVLVWADVRDGKYISREQYEAEVKLIKSGFDSLAAEKDKTIADLAETINKKNILITELQKKLEECQNQVPQPPLQDGVKWKLNGKTEETIANGVKIIKNYTIDESI